jgi:hypothetical protein
VTAAEQHIADIRALVRWWVVAFAAMASTAVAGLSVFEVGSLRPWARAVWLLILVGCFGIATAVLLAVGRVFQLPRDWSELSREEQQRSADFGAGPEQLAVWDRSTTDRHRADEVRQQVVAAVRLADSGTALRRMRALLGAAAAAVLVLLVALVVVRDAGREPAGSCTTSLRSCAAAQVERPTPVTVRLNTDGAGSDAGARREVARRLGGPGCRPAGRFEAVATGGTLATPVVVVDLPGCATARFVLDAAVGVAIPRAATP